MGRRRKPTPATLCHICWGTVTLEEDVRLPCHHPCHETCWQQWMLAQPDMQFTFDSCVLCNVPKLRKERFCPGCGIQFVRDGGCNHMTCPICRWQFDIAYAPTTQPLNPFYSWRELAFERKCRSWRKYINCVCKVLMGVLVGLVAHLLLQDTMLDQLNNFCMSFIMGLLVVMQLFTTNEGYLSPKMVGVGCLFMSFPVGISIWVRFL